MATNEIPEGYDCKPSSRRLPNRIADDPRLNLIQLCLLTYRIAHGDLFGLNKKDVSNRFGMGAPSFYSGIRQLKELGYIKREQSGERPSAGFRFAVDTINLRAAPPGRGGYVVWTRDTFNHLADLNAKQTGLLIYLHSHAPQYPVTAAKVARRFKISERTVKSILRDLVSLKLLTRQERRDPSGRFSLASFAAIKPIVVLQYDTSYEEWLFRLPNEEASFGRWNELYTEAGYHVDETYDEIGDEEFERALSPLVLEGRMTPRLLEDQMSLQVLRKIICVQADYSNSTFTEAARKVCEIIHEWCGKNPSKSFKSWGVVGQPILVGRYSD